MCGFYNSGYCLSVFAKLPVRIYLRIKNRRCCFRLWLTVLIVNYLSIAVCDIFLICRKRIRQRNLIILSVKTAIRFENRITAHFIPKADISAVNYHTVFVNGCRNPGVVLRHTVILVCVHIFFKPRQLIGWFVNIFRRIAFFFITGNRCVNLQLIVFRYNSPQIPHAELILHLSRLLIFGKHNANIIIITIFLYFGDLVFNGRRQFFKFNPVFIDVFFGNMDCHCQFRQFQISLNIF